MRCDWANIHVRATVDLNSNCLLLYVVTPFAGTPFKQPSTYCTAHSIYLRKPISSHIGPTCPAHLLPCFISETHHSPILHRHIHLHKGPPFAPPISPPSACLPTHIFTTKSLRLCQVYVWLRSLLTGKVRSCRQSATCSTLSGLPLDLVILWVAIPRSNL